MQIRHEANLILPLGREGQLVELLDRMGEPLPRSQLLAQVLGPLGDLFGVLLLVPKIRLLHPAFERRELGF